MCQGLPHCMIRATPIFAVRVKGATKGVRSRGSGVVYGFHGDTQSIGGHGQCYAIPDRPEVETLNIVITGIVPICLRPTSIVFYPRLTFFYVSMYFPLGFNSTSEPLAMSIYIST